MTQLDNLLEVITDPYQGREEGVDFWVDEEGYIQTMDVRTAALIMRTANNSGEFTQNLVKVGQKGGSILLGFDTLVDLPPVHIAKIGYLKSVNAEIKTDGKKFSVYLDGKRSTRVFNKLASAKTYIKRLDKDLQTTGNIIENYEESDD